MCDRQLWNELGGMDELLTVTMNDVDICLRALTKGRYTIYTPHVELTHYVSSSRGNLDPKADRNRFISRWDIFGDFQDPFFPAALRLLGERMFYRPPTTPPTRQ
jgi:GT2 family glycosyltransferase